MTITTDSTLEVNPKEALPSGAPVDRVVLRYSQPSHGAFFASVMQRLQQPEVSPRQLLEALSTAVEEMEAEETRKAEEEARRIEEEKRRIEEEKRRIEEEKRREEEEKRRKEEEMQKAIEAQRIEEEKKAKEEAKRIIEETKRAEEIKIKAEEEARRIYEEKKRAEETKRMEEAGKALEEARKAYEDAKKAQDEARRAEDEAKRAAEQSARSCGVCLSPNPSARAVFATCGHVACLKCAESAAARSSGRLECPFCAAPTTYMRLFEREMITKGVESSPKPSSRCVRFCDKDEVKEFDKDEDVVDTSTVSTETTVSAIPKGGNPGCGLNWFGKKN